MMKKNSTIVVFRRLSTELRAPGAIWQEASTVFKRLFGNKVIVRGQTLELLLPEYNSICKFSHLQHESDVISHLGAQYSVVCFDEAVTFDLETMILPLLGRLRNANVDYVPRMYLATNPSYRHKLYSWIRDFYLDEEGIPLKEKSNIERYFVLQNNEPLWYNSLEEAQSIHGCGLESGIRSFRSIRAHVSDNIPLIKNNPDYISNLLALPPVKRAIFYSGSWIAREEEAGLFKREWLTPVAYPNLKAKQRVRAYDLASQPVSTQVPNPDWTRGLLCSKDPSGVYTIEDLVSVRDRPHVVDQLILNTARADGPGVLVSIPQDPGQAGYARAMEMKKKLAEIGVSCKIVKPNTSKRTRFLPFSAIAEARYMQYVKADWNEVFLDELEEFTGLTRHERDDICDAASDAILVLNQTKQIPMFDLPDFTMQSAISELNQGASIPTSGLTL